MSGSEEEDSEEDSSEERDSEEEGVSPELEGLSEEAGGSFSEEETLDELELGEEELCSLEAKEESSLFPILDERPSWLPPQAAKRRHDVANVRMIFVFFTG